MIGQVGAEHEGVAVSRRDGRQAMEMVHLKMCLSPLVSVSLLSKGTYHNVGWVLSFEIAEKFKLQVVRHWCRLIDR